MTDSSRVMRRMNPYFRSKRRKKLIGDLFSYLMLIMLAFVFIFPFLWMISTAFKLPSEAYTLPQRLIPKTFTFDNFIEGWKYADFTRYTINTLVVALTATLGAVFSAALVAYGFARFRSRYNGFFFSIVLATLMLPSQVTLIPTYLLFTKFGWLDTLKPLIVPSFFGGGAFNIFLLRQFLKTIPKDLDEAAYIDGANSFQIFSRIPLPAIRPAMIAVALMSITYHWNDYFWPLI